MVRAKSKEDFKPEISAELQMSTAAVPEPIDELDALESDPIFALFIEAIYQDALAHPERLWSSKDVYGDDILDLIKDVDISDDK